MDTSCHDTHDRLVLTTRLEAGAIAGLHVELTIDGSDATTCGKRLASDTIVCIDELLFLEGYRLTVNILVGEVRLDDVATIARCEACKVLIACTTRLELQRSRQTKEVEPVFVRHVHRTTTIRRRAGDRHPIADFISILGIYEELVIVPEPLVGRGIRRAIPIEVIELPLVILVEIALSEVTEHLRSLVVELTVQRVSLTTLWLEVSTTDRSDVVVRTAWGQTTSLDVLRIDVQDGGRRRQDICQQIGSIRSRQLVRSRGSLTRTIIEAPEEDSLIRAGTASRDKEACRSEVLIEVREGGTTIR